jgi:K+/H+ antiporter YhaU regulatory subunit KhtT
VVDAYQVLDAAVRGADGVIDTSPSFDRVLVAGDRLVVLGTPEQLSSLAQAI